MLLSMTGYGRASSTYEKKTISVEVRSLNSKYTDIRLKVPSNFREREHQLRKLLTNKAERGKIEMTIEVKSMTGDDGYGLNMPLFKKYFSELSALADELGTSKEGLMQGILRIPNVVMAEDSDIDEEEWKAILNTVNEALEKFHSFRLAEGAAMEEDLRLRVNNILQALEQVNPFEKERIVLLQNRLRQNLQEFFGKENVDENRFEQEVIFYLEKIDITEEKVRLEVEVKVKIE